MPRNRPSNYSISLSSTVRLEHVPCPLSNGPLHDSSWAIENRAEARLLHLFPFLPAPISLPTADFGERMRCGADRSEPQSPAYGWQHPVARRHPAGGDHREVQGRALQRLAVACGKWNSGGGRGEDGGHLGSILQPPSFRVFSYEGMVAI